MIAGCDQITKSRSLLGTIAIDLLDTHDLEYVILAMYCEVEG